MRGEMDQNVCNLVSEAYFIAMMKDAELRLEYADKYAHAGIRSLFLVNGAAIISLLTFIGNTGTVFDKRGLFWAFFWLAVGLSFALLANFGAYFSQNYYMLHSQKTAWNAKYDSYGLTPQQDSSKEIRIGHSWIGVAIFSSVMSFAMFVTGIFVALIAIT